MRLKQLTLENFQGIKHLVIEPRGKSIAIHGDNATGKTTLGNAMTWLLYGKSLADEKNFSPKVLDEDGNEIHNIENSVEAVFENNGKVQTLKKVSTEDWRQKRGNKDAEFNGNVIHYFIGGMPAKLKDYQKFIDGFCDPEKAKILTNPFFFPRSLSWQERRNALLDIAGDIEIQAVIQSDEKLSALSSRLIDANGDALSVTDILKTAKSQLAKINEELRSIPVRIDEVEKAKPDTKGMFKEVFQREIEENEEILTAYQLALLQLKRGVVDKSLEENFYKLKSSLMQEKDSYENKVRKQKLNEATLAKESAENLRKATQEIKEWEKDFDEATKKKAVMKEQKEKLLKHYREVRETRYDGSDHCPTCGQQLEEERIKEIIEKFNVEKSISLEKINKRGKETCSRAMVENIDEKLNVISSRIETHQKALKLLEMNHAALLSSFKEMKAFEKTQRYDELNTNLTLLKMQLDEPNSAIEEQENKLKKDIVDVKKILDDLKTKILTIQKEKQHQTRILALETQEKTLRCDYENIENVIFLCELFVKKKVELLNEQINDHFETVRFKLFDEQINGGLKECCDVLVPCKEGLIPFSAANNAGRINAGIEIIDVLSKHWGVEMPLIVDNAESVTKIRETDRQVIQLVVDKTTQTLKIMEEN